MNKLIGMLLLVAIGVGTVHAGDSSPAPAAQPAPAPPAAAAPRPAATTGPHVPTLEITWNCGECTQNDKVIPLILQGYTARAAKDGLAVASDDVAKVEIVTFKQRNPGMRVMFGVLAGKDKLGLKVSYKGSEFVAEDYSANIAQGMNAICESVAGITYDKVRVVGAK